MENFNKITVSLELEGKHHELGEMVYERNRVYFRYLPDFLKTGLNISPIKLPFNAQINACEREPFEGLYGVFSDSLPDGWGRLLLDRALTSKGIDALQLNPLHRLGYVGSNGMGALSYRPKMEDDDRAGSIELDLIAHEMTQILKGSESDLIEELFELGGSSGGARPKIFVKYNPTSGEIIHGTQQHTEDFEDWIIKFPSSSDHREIAKIEYAYYLMARKAGLEMSDCKLFTGKSGQVYFGTKRFDRKLGQKIHMHTASGLMHDNFRMSNMDYGHLMDCAFRLEKNIAAYAKVLRMAAFNVFARNRDDHSKNFSFLMNAQGEWRLAPAYDLTYSNSAYGFHSTMVAGESKNPERKHLMSLAKHFGIIDASAILDEVKDAVAQWSSFAKDSDLSAASIKSIANVIIC